MGETMTEANHRPGTGAFLGESSLPLDPVARRHEKRGRRWFVVSYFFCPCHLPLVLALAGGALGGSALGAAITGNVLRAGTVLTAIYLVVVWRGFRQVRRAKRIEAAGGANRCGSGECEVVGRGGVSAHS